MKVLILNTSERTGGAAVAANRLMNALCKQGVEANMLVRDKQSEDERVISVNQSWFQRRLNFLRFVWERLVIFLCNKLNRKDLFRVSIANTGVNVAAHPLVKEADVIHLHWINQGFLSLKGLRQLIATGKPIVWTLHDMWPATAICHYPGDCTKYLTACSHCALSVPHPLWDLAVSTFRQKGRVALNSITFVGCSQWIAQKAKQGKWLQSASFTSIPNPIDVSVFKPVERIAARRHFHLAEEKQFVLFAAAKLSEVRKGAAYFVEACQALYRVYGDRMEVLLMGNCADELKQRVPFKVNELGYLSDTQEMALVYNCADLFAIPSLEDNLPNTIMEAMACGTPCVGFQTGGIPEMIDHEQNGYVAHYQDAKDLAKGIQWVINHPDPEALRQACVEKVRTHYAEEVVAQQYIKLYEQLLKR